MRKRSISLRLISTFSISIIIALIVYRKCSYNCQLLHFTPLIQVLIALIAYKIRDIYSRSKFLQVLFEATFIFTYLYALYGIFPVEFSFINLIDFNIIFISPICEFFFSRTFNIGNERLTIGVYDLYVWWVIFIDWFVFGFLYFARDSSINSRDTIIVRELFSSLCKNCTGEGENVSFYRNDRENSTIRDSIVNGWINSCANLKYTYNYYLILNVSKSTFLDKGSMKGVKKYTTSKDVLFQWLYNLSNRFASLVFADGRTSKDQHQVDVIQVDRCLYTICTLSHAEVNGIIEKLKDYFSESRELTLKVKYSIVNLFGHELQVLQLDAKILTKKDLELMNGMS